MKKTRLIKKLTLVHYTDPGHGWLKVNKSILKALNIADKISTYSYMRNKDAYLEQDSDADLLLEGLKSAGVRVSIVERNCRDRQSKIRGYNYFRNDLTSGTNP